MTDFIEECLGKAPPDAAGRPCGDVKFVDAYPRLAAFLTTLRHKDGKRREVATLSIRYTGVEWQAFLNEREKGLSLCAQAATYAGLPKALEQLLNGDVIPWREWAPGGPSKRRKRGVDD